MLGRTNTNTRFEDYLNSAKVAFGSVCIELPLPKNLITGEAKIDSDAAEIRDVVEKDQGKVTQTKGNNTGSKNKHQH